MVTFDNKHKIEVSGSPPLKTTLFFGSLRTGDVGTFSSKIIGPVFWGSRHSSTCSSVIGSLFRSLLTRSVAAANIDIYLVSEK